MYGNATIRFLLLYSALSCGVALPNLAPVKPPTSITSVDTPTTVDNLGASAEQQAKTAEEIAKQAELCAKNPKDPSCQDLQDMAAVDEAQKQKIQESQGTVEDSKNAVRKDGGAETAPDAVAEANSKIGEDPQFPKPGEAAPVSEDTTASEPGKDPVHPEVASMEDFEQPDASRPKEIAAVQETSAPSAESTTDSAPKDTNVSETSTEKGADVTDTAKDAPAEVPKEKSIVDYALEAYTGKQYDDPEHPYNKAVTEKSESVMSESVAEHGEKTRADLAAMYEDFGMTPEAAAARADKEVDAAKYKAINAGINDDTNASADATLDRMVKDYDNGTTFKADDMTHIYSNAEEQTLKHADAAGDKKSAELARIDPETQPNTYKVKEQQLMVATVAEQELAAERANYNAGEAVRSDPFVQKEAQYQINKTAEKAWNSLFGQSTPETKNSTPTATLGESSVTLGEPAPTSSQPAASEPAPTSTSRTANTAPAETSTGTKTAATTNEAKPAAPYVEVPATPPTSTAPAETVEAPAEAAKVVKSTPTAEPSSVEETPASTSKTPAEKTPETTVKKEEEKPHTETAANGHTGGGSSQEEKSGGSSSPPMMPPSSPPSSNSSGGASSSTPAPVASATQPENTPSVDLSAATEVTTPSVTNAPSNPNIKSASTTSTPVESTKVEEPAAVTPKTPASTMVATTGGEALNTDSESAGVKQTPPAQPPVAYSPVKPTALSGGKHAMAAADSSGSSSAGPFMPTLMAASSGGASSLSSSFFSTVFGETPPEESPQSSAPASQSTLDYVYAGAATVAESIINTVWGQPEDPYATADLSTSSHRGLASESTASAESDGTAPEDALLTSALGTTSKKTSSK